MPNDEYASIWEPRTVVWHYYGGVVEALTALRSLPAPDEPAAPVHRYEPPRECQPRELTVTRAERELITYRAPVPSTPFDGATS